MVLKQGRYVARLDRERCNRCGLCHEACPGHAVDFDGLSAAFFGDISEDMAVGRYLGSYVGHALDESVRYDSSSGGIVSALLIHALEKGLIDGALVTRMRRDDPLASEPFLARTREEILAAARSKYCPVAGNTVLREVLDSEDRIAVVGLPCHIQGLRKAEQCIPRLAEQIRYHISFACNLNFSFQGTTRCTLCSDMLGELSDLTCGDASIPLATQAGGAGSSFVVSRTSAADELLESAASHRVVELSELELKDLLSLQDHALSHKRKLQARLRLFRLAGRSVPVYRQKLLKPVRADYFSTLKLYAARFALSGNRGQNE
jgi:coenzyme F420-reducing hydrogenase beta subunit